MLGGMEIIFDYDVRNYKDILLTIRLGSPFPESPDECSGSNTEGITISSSSIHSACGLNIFMGTERKR